MMKSPASRRRRRPRSFSSTMFLCSTYTLSTSSYALQISTHPITRTSLISPPLQPRFINNNGRRQAIMQGSYHMRRSSRIVLLAMDNHDGIGGEHSEEEFEEDEYHNDVKAALNKISWLPNVNLGKQPYKPHANTSRRESLDGNSYIEADNNIIENGVGGYQNIEVLPILPMEMVHGLEGINLDSESEDLSEESLLSSSNNYYGTGVWDEGGSDPNSLISTSTLGPLFSGTSNYLPHTKGHVFTVAEPRYKKLYDDLLRMGNYYAGKKKRSAIAKLEAKSEVDASSLTTATHNIPDPDEKRRFIVTAQNPSSDGEFAEYGLLFQLKDLDEVAAVASYEMGGDDGSMTLEELQELVEMHGDEMSMEGSESGEDIRDILLQTHYEATHDVVGRVKIHRIVNPEVYSEGYKGDEYLMAEATILDLVENDRVKMLKERKQRKTAAAASTVQAEQEQQPAELTASRMLEEQTNEAVGNAVERIKDELRSSLGEAFRQQTSQLDSDSVKKQLRASLDELNDVANMSSNRKSSIPLVPKGIYVEKRSDESLTKEEKALRESFTELVSLQHEIKEECRFTRVSVQTFGIGTVGVWLSCAAWSQFVAKRLEATHGDMQKDLQQKLVQYLADRASESGPVSEYFMEEIDGADVIEFDELSVALQNEFQLVQGRATEELGPLALERAIMMQRIVQAESYSDRINLLRECVDAERQRLEAKKMIQTLSLDVVDDRKVEREEARSLFERLMSSSDDATANLNEPKDDEEEAFQ